MKETVNFNKTNIVLGKPYAIEEFVKLLQAAQKAKEIENDFDFLPSPVVHHENYDVNFKGFLWENKNPIIFIQNKEYLETCLNSKDSGYNIVSTDFDVVQVDLESERDEKGNLIIGENGVVANLVYKVYSKEEARQMMINEEIDLRDVTFGGYGEI